MKSHIRMIILHYFFQLIHFKWLLELLKRCDLLNRRYFWFGVVSLDRHFYDLVLEGRVWELGLADLSRRFIQLTSTMLDLILQTNRIPRKPPILNVKISRRNPHSHLIRRVRPVAIIHPKTGTIFFLFFVRWGFGIDDFRLFLLVERVVFSVVVWRCGFI